MSASGTCAPPGPPSPARPPEPALPAAPSVEEPLDPHPAANASAAANATTAGRPAARAVGFEPGELIRKIMVAPAVEAGLKPQNDTPVHATQQPRGRPCSTHIGVRAVHPVPDGQGRGGTST